MTSGYKTDFFVMSVGRHLRFMQITKISQRGCKGSQTGIVLGTPRRYKSAKNVKGKNISMFDNEFIKQAPTSIDIARVVKRWWQFVHLYEAITSQMLLQPTTIKHVLYVYEIVSYLTYLSCSARFNANMFDILSTHVCCQYSMLIHDVKLCTMTSLSDIFLHD